MGVPSHSRGLEGRRTDPTRARRCAALGYQLVTTSRPGTKWYPRLCAREVLRNEVPEYADVWLGQVRTHRRILELHFVGPPSHKAEDTTWCQNTPMCGLDRCEPDELPSRGDAPVQATH